VLIATHPHDLPSGKKRLVKFVDRIQSPAFVIRSQGEKVQAPYDAELEEDNRLGKYGRAALQERDADRIVSGDNTVFLLGGNLSECLASTYNSILRALERKQEEIRVVFIEDLVFLQTAKGEKKFLELLLKRGSKSDLENYFQMYKESNRVVKKDFIPSEKI